jgi:hypothetical protein
MGKSNGFQAGDLELDLVGLSEASLILGVEKSRIGRWLKENAMGKDSIPEPIARLKCGPIWERSQIIIKLRMLHAQAGGHENDETSFEEWRIRRSLARAESLGFSGSKLREVLRARGAKLSESAAP